MTARSPRGRSPAEWTTLALSLLIVGALVATALREEANLQGSAGAGVDVTFDEENATLRGDRFSVPYTVMNTGSTAIASAEIWIEVYDGERLVESAEVTVQFLPLNGKQDGIYVTALDPVTHTFRGRLESLQFP
jgi:uncharacterized protein (TIGR02588 family)